MPRIEPALLPVVSDLARGLRELGVPFGVVGALVPELLLDARPARVTNDADVAVVVASLADFESLKDRLADYGFARTRLPHRMQHRSGGWVDMLPFSESIAPEGRLQLQEGFVLNMAGFRHVVSNAVATAIDDGPTLPLAPLPLYALLKMVAFDDRKASKDLAGVFHCFQHYLEDDERRYDAEHDGEGVPYEYTGAYLLGVDGRPFLDAELAGTVIKVLDRFPPPEYREIELLVQKAEILLRSGNRNAARDVVERAIKQSRDGSWIYWLDGAKRMVVLRALKQIDRGEGIRRARQEFSEDLAAGKLSPTYLLADLGDILELLEVDWPANAVLEAVDDYLEQVIAASPPSQPYESLTGESTPSWSPDYALCHVVVQFLAFPVVDVAVAARRALARYTSAHGRELAALLVGSTSWNPLQLEHILAALQVAVTTGAPQIEGLRTFVEGLNQSESLAVRSVAKRICDQQGWAWIDITTAPADPVILIAGSPGNRREAGMVLGGDTTIAWNLHQALIDPLERAGLDRNELMSEFERAYRALEADYPWADDARLQRWMRLLLARFWLNPRAIVGREAGMRVFGRRSLSGQVPPGAEDAYDRFYPLYDAQLELHQPVERPPELQAMEWRITGNEGQAWRQGAGADDWSHYPDSVRGMSLIGERTWFVRPEWEWPHEERSRGLILGLPDGAADKPLESAYELTYDLYLEGRAQYNKQLVVLNDENQLIGSAYRWAAINSNFARALGWHPSTSVPLTSKAEQA